MAFGSGAFLAANISQANELIPAVQSSKFKGAANLGSVAAASLAGLFGPLLDWGTRASTVKRYAVLFAAITVVILIGAVAARPGLAVRPAIGETLPERSRP